MSVFTKAVVGLCVGIALYLGSNYFYSEQHEKEAMSMPSVNKDHFLNIARMVVGSHVQEPMISSYSEQKSAYSSDFRGVALLSKAALDESPLKFRDVQSWDLGDFHNLVREFPSVFSNVTGDPVGIHKIGLGEVKSEVTIYSMPNESGVLLVEDF